MMSNKHNQLFVKLLFLSAMCMASVGAMATDRVLDVGHHGLDSVLLAPYIAVLEDPDQKLTLSDVQQPNLANQFALTQATAQDLNYGFTRSAYWFRLTLQNDSNAPVYRMLEISFPTLSDIQFYQPTTGGSYRVLKTGVALPFSTRAYPNRFFVFPIALPVRSMQTYYLRVQSVSGILIPARLWEPQAFHVHERNEYAIQTGYFGIAAALIFYNLFLYFGLRDIVYLLYSIFATTMALAISAANGIGMEYIWPETSFWSNISLNVLYSLALGALLIFFRRILDISAIAPRVDRLLKVLIGAMFLFPVGFVVSMETFAESSSILQAFAGVVILTVLLYCACFKGHRIAALLATSFSMLLIGGLMVELKTLTLIPSNRFTEQGMQLGSLLEMLLLAFTLAYRFSLIRRQATEDVQKANSNLEQRLQARETELTAIHLRLRESEHLQTLSQERQRLMLDMHDGMGASLTSALRVVERGQLDEAAVAQVLKSCIDDLKLAIDSMEPVDADLLLLLATLRFRLGPRLEASGIWLKWEIQKVPRLEWLDPKTSLHILRILQEAFTNIIKHAHATEISVVTNVQADQVVIMVSDNGKGFVVQHLPENAGKGLANQRRRAKAIGADVTWGTGSAGTCLMLHLPIEQA